MGFERALSRYRTSSSEEPARCSSSPERRELEASLAVSVVKIRGPHLGKVRAKVQVDAYKSFTCGCVRHIVHYVHLIRACRSVRYHSKRRCGRHFFTKVMPAPDRTTTPWSTWTRSQGSARLRRTRDQASSSTLCRRPATNWG